MQPYGDETYFHVQGKLAEGPEPAPFKFHEHMCFYSDTQTVTLLLKPETALELSDQISTLLLELEARS